MLILKRTAAMIAGGMILAAVAHVTTEHTGGYGTAHAALTWTVAFGVLVGSVFSGMAFSAGRWPIALALLACGLCSEGYNFLKTGDRLIAEIDRVEAPKREAIEAYAAARKRVADLEARVASPEETSKRLKDAVTAKAVADQAIVAKSAERGCLTHCRALLENAADAAAAEVKAARDALKDGHKSVKADLDAARAAFAKMSTPESVSPLADTLGISPRTLSILIAGLGSIGINGLAMFLLIYGAHTHTPHEVRPRMLDRLLSRLRARPASAVASTTRAATVATTPPARAAGNVVKLETKPKIDAKPLIAYMARHVPEASGAQAEWGDMLRGFRVWCANQTPPIEPMSAEAFGLALSAICQKADIRTLERNGRVYCVNRTVVA